MTRSIKPLVTAGIGILLLSVPAFLNQSTILFTDSRSYYVGGRLVLDRAAVVINHLLNHAADASAVGPATTHFKAVRSIYYSVPSYLLASTASLWAIVLVQAALTVWVLAVTIKTFQPTRRLLPIVAFLTLFSTLPWTASMFMPDIFTALTVLALACLAISWDDLSRRLRIALLIMLCASTTMHFTNIPIAIALVVAAAFMQWPVKRWARWGAISGAVALAMAALLFVSVVGFGKWTIAPQNPPFLLARTIEDGPAKLYLREKCPQINLVMCHHLDGLDTTADDFVWRGVFAQASPEEQDAIRAETLPIIIPAIMEHPWLQLRASVIDYLAQLSSFNLVDTRFPNWAELTPTDMIYHIDVHIYLRWLIVLSLVHYCIVAVALLSLVCMWGDLTPRAKQLIVLAFLGILLNSFTGAISTPSPRYGARIIWLVPFVAALLLPLRHPSLIARLAEPEPRSG